jgi:hypothetical protein
MKFKKYDRVLSEDCNRKIEKISLICYNFYSKVTDRNERYRINYGIVNFALNQIILMVVQPRVIRL